MSKEKLIIEDAFKNILNKTNFLLEAEPDDENNSDDSETPEETNDEPKDDLEKSVDTDGLDKDLGSEDESNDDDLGADDSDDSSSEETPEEDNNDPRNDDNNDEEKESNVDKYLKLRILEDLIEMKAEVSKFIHIIEQSNKYSDLDINDLESIKELNINTINSLKRIKSNIDLFNNNFINKVDIEKAKKVHKQFNKLYNKIYDNYKKESNRILSK